MPLTDEALRKEQERLVEDFGLKTAPAKHGPGLGRDCIHYHCNSGAQAIGLAYLMGAGQIVLLGYDMQTTYGKSHWFGDHPEGPLRVGNSYASWVGKFRQLAKDLASEGVDVVNCSRETALDCFRRDTLENVL